MIGQGLSLEHLIPRAVSVLERDPLAEGDFYPGDLLKNVLTSPEPSYWQQHPEQAQRLRRLIEGVQPRTLTWTTTCLPRSTPFDHRSPDD